MILMRETSPCSCASQDVEHTIFCASELLRMTPSLHQSSKVHLVRTHDLSIATSDSMIHSQPSSLLHFHQPNAFHFFPLLPPAALAASFFARATHHISRIILSHFKSQRIAKIAADLSRFMTPTTYLRPVSDAL